jgi:hypothetical protein
MSASPYATPASVSAALGDPGAGPAEIYDVGFGQKALVWLVLASLSPFLPLAVRAFLGPVCAAFAYRATRHLSSPPAAVAMALLCGLPLLGLVAIGFVSMRATRALRAAGIPVGMMGADVWRLRAASRAAEPAR